MSAAAVSSARTLAWTPCHRGRISPVPAELTAEGFVADLVPFVPAGLGEEF